MADKLPPTPPKGKQPRSVESYLRPDVVQQVQRLELQQQEQQVQQLELQQQVLVQVQEQRLLLFCRKQPEPKPAGKRSATIFS